MDQYGTVMIFAAMLLDGVLWTRWRLDRQTHHARVEDTSKLRRLIPRAKTTLLATSRIE